MKYVSRQETKIELISLLEKIVEEPWTSNLSKNEQKYLDLLHTYKQIGGDYDLFSEEYIKIINTKELVELERRQKH